MRNNIMLEDTHDQNEEDCGSDFDAPLVYSNNGYTLDYTTIAISKYKYKDKDKDKDKDDPLVIPEPSMILLVAIGLIAILFARTRK